MSIGTTALSQSFADIRGIYCFSFAVLFSLAPWLRFCLGGWLRRRTAWESSHQHSGEVKSQTDGAFPGGLVTWLMALLRACPGIDCQYNSLPLFPLASFHLEPILGVYLSHEVTACLSITLSPSPPLHIPSGPLSSRSTELLFIVTGRTVQCITLTLYCKGLFRRKCRCESVKKAKEPLHNVCLMLNENKHEHSWKMRQRNGKYIAQIHILYVCTIFLICQICHHVTILFIPYFLFLFSIDCSLSFRVVWLNYDVQDRQQCPITLSRGESL